MARKKSQVDKFKEAARQAGADESEDAFNATLKNVAKSPREAKEMGRNTPDKQHKTKR